MSEEDGQNSWGVKTDYTKTIGGRTYSTTLYPAGVAFDEHIPYIIRLAKGPIGVTLDMLRSLVRHGLSGADVPGSEMREGLGALADEIASGGSAKVCALLAFTFVERPKGGGKANCSSEFDEVFQGRYAHLCEVLAWVLKVNFAPLSGGAASGAWGRIQQWVSALLVESQTSPSEPTSTPGDGSSSDSSTSSA